MTRYFEMTNHFQIVQHKEKSRHYIIPIFVPHRGCPNDCIFCNQKHITGHQDVVDSSYVEREIQKYIATFKSHPRFVEVSFFGGSFTGLPANEQKSLLEPARKALKAGIIDAIRLSTRPDYIDQNILDNLKEYCVSIIELGVQSMDEEVLRLSNRGHSVDDVYKASELINEYNFTLGLQMMVGLPGDSKEKDIKTAEEFIHIKPSMVRIYPALVIRDTYMEYMYKKGSYEPTSLTDAVDICSSLYLLFERAGIQIIRIGLQPTENMTPGKDIVAGPFHPAFRELVESKLFNNMIEYLYRNQSEHQVNVIVNNLSISKLYSNKKYYFKKLLETIAPDKIYVEQDVSIPVDSVLLKNSEKSQIMSIKDYSLTVYK